MELFRLPVIEFTESIVAKLLKFSTRGRSVRGGKPPPPLPPPPPPRPGIAPGAHLRGTTAERDKQKRDYREWALMADINSSM